MHLSMHIYMGIRIYTCLCLYTYAHAYVYTHTYIINAYENTHMYMPMKIHIWICLYTYTYVYSEQLTWIIQGSGGGQRTGWSCSGGSIGCSTGANSPASSRIFADPWTTPEVCTSFTMLEICFSS